MSMNHTFKLGVVYLSVDDGRIDRKPRKPLYVMIVMVKTIVSCRLSLRSTH